MVRFHLYGMCRIGKPRETKSRLVVAKGLGRGKQGDWILNTGFPLGVMKVFGN